MAFFSSEVDIVQIRTRARRHVHIIRGNKTTDGLHGFLQYS